MDKSSSTFKKLEFIFYCISHFVKNKCSKLHSIIMCNKEFTKMASEKRFNKRNTQLQGITLMVDQGDFFRKDVLLVTMNIQDSKKDKSRHTFKII